MRALGLLVVVAGCSNILGIGDLSGPAGTVDGGADASMGDAPVDGGMSLVLEGRVIREDGTTVGGVTIEAIAMPNRQRVASTTSLPVGTYMISIPYSGQSFDGYLVLRPPDPASNRFTTFVYIPPNTISQQVDLALYGPQLVDRIRADCGVPTSSQRPIVMVHVVDGAFNPVQGAQVTAQPSQVICYEDPPPGATGVTGPSGLAYVAEAPTGPFMLSALVQGTTHGPRVVDTTTNNSVHLLSLPP